MLSLVIAVALSQCTKDTDCKGERICSAGLCLESNAPREQSPVAAQLDAQRPALYWPISSLVVGVVVFIGGVLLSAFDGRPTLMFAGAAIGGSFVFGGVVSLIATLWARARVGAMMDEAK